VCALLAPSLVVLLFGDRDSLYQALGLNAYLGLLWLITARCVKEAPETPDDPLVARGPRPLLARRAVVVAATVLAVTFVYGLVTNWVRFPVLTGLWAAWVRSRPPFGETALANLVVYVLVPGAIVLALGARPRELGFSRPANGTLRAALFCIALPVAIFVWALAAGRLGAGRLAYILVRNLLSSGFSEEFLFRGLTFSHLRAFMRTEWALFVQALLFGLFHLGSSLNEPNLLVLAAYLFALNAVPGYLFGLIALRTRSLALPVTIHTTLGMMKDVFA
jgi:membrane protease YdiL (CAAX protease family)